MRKMKPIHPHAEIFPLHEGPPLWDMADRIKRNGLREPIVLLDDAILDGRRRELACIRAGVEPRYRKFGSRKEDGDDPLEFVIDHNLHRRHLGEGDRALAAARYATARVGNPTLKNSKIPEIPQSSQVETIGKTNADAANKFDVSEQTVDRAKVVIAHGTDELQGAVADETLTVSDAAKVAKESPDVQKEAVKAVKEGKAKSAKKAAAEIKEKAETPKHINDAVGIEIPEKAIKAFEDAKEIAAICKDLDGIIARVEAAGKSPGGRMLHTTSQLQTLQSVRKSLWQGRATHVCPYCRGKKRCEACKDSGWTTKAYYDQSPANVKE